jgi:hypothetical protein
VTAEELKAEVAIEFDSLEQVAKELEALRRDVTGREPTVREKTFPLTLPQFDLTGRDSSGQFVARRDWLRSFVSSLARPTDRG